MQSLYQAYQSYERKVVRGEYGKSLPVKSRPAPDPRHFSLTYRLGDELVRLGLRLMRQAKTGHALTSTTMAGK